MIKENEVQRLELPEQPQDNDVTVDQLDECSVSIRSIDQILNDLLTHVKAASPHEAANLEEGTPLDDKSLAVITCEYVIKIAQEQHWDMARHMGDYYVFNGEFWIKMTEDEIKNFLGIAAEKISINRFKARHYSFKDALLKQFYQTAFFKVPESNHLETKINVCNGTYVMGAEEQLLKPFESSDFMRYKLAFSFDSKATAPNFQKYLDKVLPIKEKQMVLAEHVGYAFIKNSVLKLEKAAFLFGSGANGKSVFFDIITGLLGEENVCNVTLEELTDNKNYAKTFLDGKLLNYASEISTRMNTVSFKTLVSGEPIMVRMIYEKPYMLKDYARFIFNTNELPADVEHNLAFIRRCNLIEFNVTIPAEERNPSLANMIIATELPGVFNWILEGMKRLLTNRSFTKCKEMDEALERYKKDNDHVALFLEDNNYSTSSTNKIALKVLYQEFRTYAKDSGYPSIQDKTFAKRLRTNGYYIERQGPGRYVYISKVKLKNHSTIDI